MNILSFLAVVAAVLFVVVLIRRASSAQLDESNVFSMLVCGCLGWWAFCDAFFYVAATKQAAWMWHQLGALGWCGFIGVTAYYFLIMAGVNKQMPLIMKCLYWIISIGLTLRFLILQPTALAEDLVQSSSGLGWTFVQTYSTIWPFVFLAYLLVYLGGSLAYVFWWQRREKSLSAQKLAVGFVVLDILSVATGCVSIFVLPYFTDYFPPVGCLATLIFLWGYRYMLWEYDLVNIELAVNPREVFECSLEAMIITDLKFHIIYANETAKSLLMDENNKWNTFLECFNPDCKKTLELFSKESKHPLKSVSLTLFNGTAVIASGNWVKTRKGRVELMIFSLHDISQLKQAQTRMEYLAHYDELTGLPNRRRFGEILDNWSEKSVEEGFDFALLFSDLNHFKEINDHFGHGAGDAALATVSVAIRQSLQNGDEAARLSGDEFVVLHRMKEGDREEDLIASLRKTIRGINTSNFAPGISLDTAVGVSLYSECANVRRMLKTADARMYEMKQRLHEAE